MAEQADATALAEIASLLRRRVEQVDEAVARQAEASQHAAELGQRAEERMKGYEDIEKSSRDSLARAEERIEQKERDTKARQDEERQFRQNLLAELQRHNSLMEQLIARLPV